MQKIFQYKSRRNQVCLCQVENHPVVVKKYQSRDAFFREQNIYRCLHNNDLPHAKVISAAGNCLIMTHLPGENLVDILEGQERSGIIHWTVWKKLISWMIDFQKITGCIMTDVNLRNFLYASETDTLYGVDFEECKEGSITQTAALLAAYIRNYAPENTPIKRKIAEYVLQEFSHCLSIPMQELLVETEKQEGFLLERRKKKG